MKPNEIVQVTSRGEWKDLSYNGVGIAGYAGPTKTFQWYAEADCVIAYYKSDFNCAMVLKGRSKYFVFTANILSTYPFAKTNFSRIVEESQLLPMVCRVIQAKGKILDRKEWLNFCTGIAFKGDTP